MYFIYSVSTIITSLWSISVNLNPYHTESIILLIAPTKPLCSLSFHMFPLLSVCFSHPAHLIPFINPSRTQTIDSIHQALVQLETGLQKTSDPSKLFWTKQNHQKPLASYFKDQKLEKKIRQDLRSFQNHCLAHLCIWICSILISLKITLFHS